MGMERFTDWMKATYDKLLAVVILSALIVSLLYLAVKIGIVRGQQKKWEAEIVNLVPSNPDADSVTPDAFKLAMARLEKPYIIPYGTWTRRLVVPEERFWCEDCKYPNPMDAKICASCEQELDSGEIPVDWDEDGDGIPNVKEKEYGLDPLDPDDAVLDKDGDGFDNLLEHRNGTDPNDPNSKPPIEAWMYVDGIEAEAFNLLFKAYSTLPDGSLIFQVNTKDAGRTYFVKMSNQVESFTLVGFKTNFVEEVKNGIRRMADKSELSLKTGERVIVLTKGERVKWDKFNATLRYDRDGRTFLVHKDDLFELEGNKYRVNSIDTSAKSVVIIRLSDSKEFDLVSDKNSGTSVLPEAQATDGGANKAGE